VVTMRYLRRAGHQPTLFEAGQSLGGVWAERPTNDVVYANLRTNLPTVVMQSPDFDFPAGLPSYISTRDLGRYIESYAEAFGVSARLSTRVTSVSPAVTGNNKWRVCWRSSSAGEGVDGSEQRGEEEFDAVAVANGHYTAPNCPELPGSAEWLDGCRGRRIVHSRDYVSPAEFAGQSVVRIQTAAATLCGRCGCCISFSPSLPGHHTPPPPPPTVKPVLAVGA
jgi:cation diffusion facilitator CzcD-associated flavoprotein CzcO